MAVAYDSSNSATAMSASSLSANVTASGSDRCALIVAHWQSGTYTAPSTVTVNGSATGVTAVNSVAYYTGNRYVFVYRLVAPPTSSVAYAVSWAGSVDEPAIGIVTYTGVDQTTPTNGSTTAVQQTTEEPTVTVSSASGELVVAAMGARYPAVSATEDGGQTERVYAADYNTTGAVISVCEEAGAASVTESWTLGAPASWGIVAVRLNPVAATASIAPLADFYAMLRRNN